MSTPPDLNADPGADEPEFEVPLPTPAEPQGPSFAEVWAADAEDALVEADSAPLIGSGVPAVVAIIVTRNPGPWFDATVASVATQEYANLATLVVDAGSVVDPADRVAAALPGAFVKRLRDAGYARAANAAAESVEGAAFLLLLHDDVELGPGAVQAMVEEAFRSNAGVVGAKLVDWDEPERLRSVGAAIDKFGFGWPVAEPGELDQAQHDAVSDVFVVSSAAMLVRCDLFADLEGFATDLEGSGEDLDLCWRARVAGARTVVTPAAVIRHRERSELGDPTASTSHLALRHQIRTVMANYSLPHLIRVVPQALVFATLEVLWSLIRGRFRSAGSVLGAVTWNVGHLPATIKARRRVAAARRVPDREIRALQIRGSARIVGFVRGRRANGNLSVQAAFQAARSRSLGGDEDALQRLAAFALTALVVLVGSRGVISGTVPAIREFTALGRPGDVWREWWSGWRPGGLGAAEGAPSLLGVVGVVEGVAAVGRGALRTALYLSPLAVGGWATWRGLKGAVSMPGRLAALAAFLANPLLHNALAEGRWQAAVVTATVPMVAVRVARAGQWAPFDHSNSPGSRQRQAVDLGLVLAAAALVAPLAIPVALGVAAVIVAVHLGVSGSRTRDVAAVVAGGAAVATILHLPWAISLWSAGDRWTRLVARDASAPDWPDLAHLVRFDTGPHGGVLSAGLLVAVLAALVLARRERGRWVVVGTCLIVASWAAVALAGRQLGSRALPAPELLAAPVGFGVALAIGFGVDALRSDVAGRSFGFRQPVAAVAGVALVLAAMPFLATLLGGGRWSMPSSDIVAATDSLRSRTADARMLWIGTPDALPAAGRSLAPGLGFALTEGAVTTLSSQHPTTAGAGEDRLVAVLKAARRGEVSRLGTELGRFAVRYIVVTDRAAPPPADTPRWPVDARMADALAAQLDLLRVEIVPGLVVYENLAARPLRAVVPDAQLAVAGESASTVTDVDAQLDVRSALPDHDQPTAAAGLVRADQSLIVAQNRSARWQVTVAGRSVAARPFDGWASSFDLPSDGRATLRYRTPEVTIALHLVQLTCVLCLPWLRRRRVSERRARRARTVEEAL